MPVKATVTLPDPIFEQIRRAADKSQRPVDEVLSETVIAMAPDIGGANGPNRSALAQLAYFNDAALWQAARSTMTVEQRERSQQLHDKQQSNGLTAEEDEEHEALAQLFRDTLLIRAQAAVLLKYRGYDVSDPDQFEPLE